MVSSAPSGQVLSALAYSMHVWHVMVNPGGTGSPMLAISARFAPLAAQLGLHVRVTLGYVVALCVLAERIDSFDFFGHLFLL